ncbi:enoyl-CoA hydratase/isomerase family protein [Paremcibacter congregatus]|uniref:enoyl-CoA hydratase/isomerase family protein n=1 Tax=Paremcibacter congregatus TaxID=2043170 RepID=UPI003A8D18E3
MTDPRVLLQQDPDGIAWVTLNRPHVHNAFDEVMIKELREIFDILAKDNACRAVVLRGEGKSFSAGADLEWMKRAGDFSHNQNLADAEYLAAMLNSLYSLNKLTIACVQGAAMGGGLGLVSCCDIVIADVTAKFALSEVKIGLIPATISPYVLAAIGPRQARRYFQTGERFDGQKAYDIGLVHEVVTTAEEMQAELDQLLTHLRSNGPLAVREAKRLVMDYAGQPLSSKIMEDSAERIAAIRARPEAREGLGAFLEKRKPSWSTRDEESDNS